jgi:hypothetical protein
LWTADYSITNDKHFTYRRLSISAFGRNWGNALFLFSVVRCTISTYFHTFTLLTSVRFQNVFCSKVHLNFSSFTQIQTHFPENWCWYPNTRVTNWWMYPQSFASSLLFVIVPSQTISQQWIIGSIEIHVLYLGNTRRSRKPSCTNTIPVIAIGPKNREKSPRETHGQAHIWEEHYCFHTLDRWTGR